jgi:hypothetical protein
MKLQQLSLLSRTVLICTLTSIFSSSLLSFIAPAQASIFDFFFKNRSEGNASGRSRSAASRSQCSQIEQGKTLIALVPQSNEGITTEEYPNFWFYLPFGGTSQSPPAIFRLLNEQKKSVLEKPLNLTLPAKDGLVRFSLPATEKPLVVGQKYHWYFNITCVNEQGTQSRIAVDGWIKRVEADSKLLAQLKQVPIKDKYVPYAENNIWYETITQLAENRAVNKQEWTKLLSLFGLEKFAAAPITELKPIKANK